MISKICNTNTICKVLNIINESISTVFLTCFVVELKVHANTIASCLYFRDNEPLPPSLGQPSEYPEVPLQGLAMHKTIQYRSDFEKIERFACWWLHCNNAYIQAKPQLVVRLNEANTPISRYDLSHLFAKLSFVQLCNSFICGFIYNIYSVECVYQFINNNYVVYNLCVICVCVRSKQ